MRFLVAFLMMWAFFSGQCGHASNNICLSHEKIGLNSRDIEKQEEKISIEVYAWQASQGKRGDKYSLTKGKSGENVPDRYYEILRRRFKFKGIEFLDYSSELKAETKKNPSQGLIVLWIDRPICWLDSGRVIVRLTVQMGKGGGGYSEFQLKSKNRKWIVESSRALGLG